MQSIDAEAAGQGVSFRVLRRRLDPRTGTNLLQVADDDAVTRIQALRRADKLAVYRPKRARKLLSPFAPPTTSEKHVRAEDVCARIVDLGDSKGVARPASPAHLAVAIAQAD